MSSQLWEEYFKIKNTPDSLAKDNIRNQLVEYYLPIVTNVANTIMANCPNQLLDVDDLKVEGAIGLMQAIESFDPSRNVKFTTYCMMRIRGEMLDGIRAVDFVPRLDRGKQRRGELIPVEIDKELVIEKSGPLTPFEFMRVNEPRTLPDFSKINLISDLKTHLRGLNKIERLIVIMYSLLDMTMLQIGWNLELSESRISQMMTRIKQRKSEVVRYSKKSYHRPSQGKSDVHAKMTRRKKGEVPYKEKVEKFVAEKPSTLKEIYISLDMSKGTAYQILHRDPKFFRDPVTRKYSIKKEEGCLSTSVG